MRIEFVIHSTPKIFYGWLREYTQEKSYAGSLQFPFGRDLVQLHPATVESNANPHSPVVRLRLRSHQLIMGDDGVTFTVAGGFSGNEAISFKLVPLDDRRTEVTATCDIPLIEPYFRQLLKTIGRKYMEAAPSIELQLDEPDETQADWRASFAKGMASAPWEGVLPLSLEDVDAATYEHLERLPGKRFPAAWEVQVARYNEREGIAIGYDIQSVSRTVGHLRITRVGEQQTRLGVTAFRYGNEADEVRLREITAAFAERWLGELPDKPAPLGSGVNPTPFSIFRPDDLELVNLNSTAGGMSPGLYPVNPSQAKVLRSANAVIGNLKDEIGPEVVSLPADSVAEGEKSIDELRKALLSMGYPADQIERAIEEYRREQQMVRDERLDEKTSETQDLAGAFIEPTMEVFPGVLSQERDGVVTNRLLADVKTDLKQVIALLEGQSDAAEQAGSGYWPDGYWPAGPRRDVTVAKLPRPSRKPPGRNTDTEYDVAFQMIVEGGFTEEAADRAYEYCCKQRGIASPKQDDRKAFNAAMDRRDKKARGNIKHSR